MLRTSRGTAARRAGSSRRTLLGPAIALVLLASSCSLGGDDGPEKVADSLADGLASYDVATVPFTADGAAATFQTLVEPLTGHPSKVTVGKVTQDGAEATAVLHWKTDLAGRTWSHDTTAHLVERAKKWRVVWAPTLVESSLQDKDTLAVTTVKARRGRILGAGGAPIVLPRPVLRIGLDKTKVPTGRDRTSAQELARVLHLDVPAFVKRVLAAGPKAFVEALVLRKQGLAADYALTWSGIVGAVAISDHLPLAPTKRFAAQLLGTVGPATAELIEKSNGRLEAGDDTGLSGLELRYDEQLGGTSGLKVSAVRSDGTREALFDVAPVAGKDLRTSLDPRLQQRADDLLADTGSDSALVAVRPSTGEIVAAASGPDGNGYNTATYGRYAPGSTFKVVSALALLRTGLTPDSTVTCPATVTVNGKRFKNYSDYPPGHLGDITLEAAVANSCNTAFISQRDRLDATGLGDAAASLGFGVDHDLGFPAFFGAAPAASGETEAAADMIGQGKILASPMAMATVLASVMKGRTVVPHLLPAFAPEADPPTPLTAKEARQLRSMLAAVVRDGSGTLLQDLGPGTLAKTGTAEFGEPGADGTLPTHAWMIGGHDDLAVAVFVDVGDSGSGTAGPLLHAFLQAAR